MSTPKRKDFLPDYGLTDTNLLGRYARLDLLILDELGYVSFSKEGAELLFQILAVQHQREEDYH